MLAGLNIDMSVNPQLQKTLFAAPAEIHDAIYAYLVPSRIPMSLYKDSFRLSICVQRDEDSDPNCFTRRTNDDDFIMNPVH